jgi:lipopolysaccharide/colanic/teichoic acid biosynthesis glycosyltransferase
MMPPEIPIKPVLNVNDRSVKMLDAGSMKAADGIEKEPQVNLSLQTTRSIYRRFGKRILDIAVVILTYPLVSPIILICMLAVITDGASPFFSHKRIGRNGKTFQCWKLRTMVPDAESRLEKLLANDAGARHEWQTTFKLKKDPRITCVGNFLRKTSFDELPQIWNVALGDMSIVGPRPVTECELQMYGTSRDVYLAMRPGLTGSWQISGRNNVSYDERVQLDVGYFNEICLRLDLKIILKTFKVLVIRTGV